MPETFTPCLVCNDLHAGMTQEARGHYHANKEGVGYIRQLVGDDKSQPEFCWRCSCRKSGYRNERNEILDRCADNLCPCHTENQAR